MLVQAFNDGNLVYEGYVRENADGNAEALLTDVKSFFQEIGLKADRLTFFGGPLKRCDTFMVTDDKYVKTTFRFAGIHQRIGYQRRRADTPIRIPRSNRA